MLVQLLQGTLRTLNDNIFFNKNMFLSGSWRAARIISSSEKKEWFVLSSVASIGMTLAPAASLSVSGSREMVSTHVKEIR